MTRGLLFRAEAIEHHPWMPEGPIPFGGMELLGRLSTGGMAEVLIARRRGPKGFEKVFALKTIRGDLARRADVRQMFLDEARLMARLTHPAVAQIYEFGEVDEILFLAMELVAGVPFTKLERLHGERNTPVPAGIVAQLGAEICWGLHAAHELTGPDGRPLGVVHRDISPHNLMLTFDGRVKILDFGIAWRRDRLAPETEVGTIKGKLSYVAPEQIMGGTVDKTSDLYSTAVVLHELLSGRKLFAGHGVSLVETMERKKVPRPSSLTPGVPRVLDEILLRALSLRPEDRYPDARELAVVLEAAARKIGGERAVEFAQRELADEEVLFRERLRAIVPPPALTSESPEPETVADLPVLPRIPRGPPIVESRAARSSPGPSPLEISELAAVRRPHVRTILLFALVLLSSAALLWLLTVMV